MIYLVKRVRSAAIGGIGFANAAYRARGRAARPASSAHANDGGPAVSRPVHLILFAAPPSIWRIALLASARDQRHRR
jgi:hypothetical protein